MMGGGCAVPFIKGRERVRIPGAAPQGAPEPPEEWGPWSCGECHNLLTQDGGCSGVCEVAFGRFLNELDAGRMDKWMLVNEVVDWVLCNIKHDDDDACNEFKEG